MEKQKINPKGVVAPPVPYTNVIKVKAANEMVFLSGVSATDPEGMITGANDILEQTRRIAENILIELEAIGLGAANIVMTTTYVLGDRMQEFLQTGACNVLFAMLDNPADTLVGVASLAGMPYGALIEVSVIAAK